MRDKKIHEEKWRENLENHVLKFSYFIQTDRQTRRPRDRASYRDARTHLKRREREKKEETGNFRGEKEKK